MDDLDSCTFPDAVLALWQAMRDKKLTTVQYALIKPATIPHATTATRLRALHSLLGTADRLDEPVRVALFDHISQGLHLFEEAS